MTEATTEWIGDSWLTYVPDYVVFPTRKVSLRTVEENFNTKWFNRYTYIYSSNRIRVCGCVAKFSLVSVLSVRCWNGFVIVKDSVNPFSLQISSVAFTLVYIDYQQTLSFISLSHSDNQSVDHKVLQLQSGRWGKRADTDFERTEI